MSYIENKVINVFIISLIVLLIIMIMLCYFNYQPYILVYGEKSDEYINIYLTDQEISGLNNRLKYKDKIIDYKIMDISHEYIIHENILKREVKIDFDYNEYDYILEIYLEVGSETNIWEYFYQKYMKGVI